MLWDGNPSHWSELYRNACSFYLWALSNYFSGLEKIPTWKSCEQVWNLGWFSWIFHQINGADHGHYEHDANSFFSIDSPPRLPSSKSTGILCWREKLHSTIARLRTSRWHLSIPCFHAPISNSPLRIDSISHVQCRNKGWFYVDGRLWHARLAAVHARVWVK